MIIARTEYGKPVFIFFNVGSIYIYFFYFEFQLDL